MDKATLLNQFQEQLGLFAKYVTYINRAKGFSDRFKPEIVAKVIEDNQAKCQEVADVLNPLAAPLQDAISGLESEKTSVIESSTSARETLETLELRAAIGELEDDDFSTQSKALQSELSDVDTKVAALDDELESLRGVASEWNALAAEYGLVEGAVNAAEEQVEEEEPAVEAAPEEEDEDEDEDELAGFIGLEEDNSVATSEPEEDETPSLSVESENNNLVDDVSAVLDDGISFSDDDLSVLDSESDISAENEVEVEGSDNADVLAYLIYQEGTAQEIRHPFEGEVMSLGRHRDNHIQIKNDSKVSRHHCRIVKDDESFFVVDNGSANGTMVNGEDVKRRRLFGGEEVIIGETFFRFRVA